MAAATAAAALSLRAVAIPVAILVVPSLAAFTVLVLVPVLLLVACSSPVVELSIPVLLWLACSSSVTVSVEAQGSGIPLTGPPVKGLAFA